MSRFGFGFGFGLNSRNSVNDIPNASSGASNVSSGRPGLVACGICGFIFLNDKDLWEHKEAHRLLDESERTRKVLESRLNAMLQQGIYSVGGQQVLLPQQQQQQHQPWLVENTRNRNLQISAAPVPSPALVSDALSRDRTKPVPTFPNFGVQQFTPPLPTDFIRPLPNQLDSALLAERMASQVDAELAARGQPEVDLTLRLGIENGNGNGNGNGDGENN